jgi:hypothetical protein
VLDADGEGVANVPVSATDGGSNTYGVTTDAEGCGFLVVNPETYTVSLSLPDYVARNGATDPASVVTVSPGSNVPLTFDYDRAGGIDFTTTLPPSMTDAVVPANVPVTLAYQFFGATGQKTYSSASFPASVTGLFPDSYQFWAGDCADADPSATYWTGGLGSAPATVPSGGSVSGELRLGAVDVDVTELGVPLVGAAVRAFHDDTNGGACPAGSPSTAGYDLGVTDANGQVRAALPFGHWQISVTGSTGTSTKLVTIDPSSSDPAYFVEDFTF